MKRLPKRKRRTVITFKAPAGGPDVDRHYGIGIRAGHPGEEISFVAETVEIIPVADGGMLWRITQHYQTAVLKAARRT